MNNQSTLLMGAVAYDPKVVTIWNGFRKYFIEHGLDFDYVLYSNYERQVEALFKGHIHVAWNSPLAWLQSQKLAESLGRKADAIVMRDSDCDLTSVVLVGKNSSIQTIADLKGKRVAVGAGDSPQATLIPLALLASKGLEPNRDFTVVPFEVLVGLHGDHIGGERDAVLALIHGNTDAACILEANLSAFLADNTMPRESARILARTEPFDHCNFTVLDGAPAAPVEHFRAILLEMDYHNPELRPLLDMEGLKAWRPGRSTGYSALANAIHRFGTVNDFIANAGARCR